MAAPVPFANYQESLTVVGSGATTYFVHANAYGGNASSGTETDIGIVYRSAGTFSYLAFGCTSSATSVTAKVRINASNGNQTITTGASPTGAFADTTHSDTISAGDKVDTSFASTGATTSVGAIGGVFASSTTTVVKLVIFGFLGAMGAGTQTYYYSVQGRLFASTTESGLYTSATMDSIVSDLNAHVVTNAHSTSTTVRYRVGGANGNQTITIGSSTTGDIEDTTHTDSVTAGTNVDIQIVTNDNSNATGVVSTEHTATSGRGWITVSRGNANSTTVSKIPPGGSAQPAATSYTDCIPVGSTSPLQNLQGHLDTIAASSGTLTVHLNGSATSLQVSVSSSAAVGIYSDTTHTATPGSAAHVVSVLPASTSTLNWFWMSWETAGAADTVTTTVTGTQATETDSSTSGSIAVSGAVYPAAGDRVLALKTATSDSWYGFLI